METQTMARKQSVADITAERDRLKIREHILSIAFLDQPDSTFRFRQGRDLYVWRAYRLSGPSGGYLVGVFHGFTNGRPNLLCAEHLDTAIQQIAERASSFADCGMDAAVYQFQNKRFAMLEHPAA